MAGLICWNCGKATGMEGRVVKSDYCPECQADLRCCRGCRFFDPMSNRQCREPISTAGRFRPGSISINLEQEILRNQRKCCFLNKLIG